ncbi:MAG: PAS domain-containing protein [Nitrosomonas sp.]|nr:PAS domain-containing protein [Nitrosomonas sp.]
MSSTLNINSSDFDSPEFLKVRLGILGKKAEIGEWFLNFSSNILTWSDSLYDFYELNRDFDCATLFDGVDFYSPSEKERMHAFIEHVVSTKAARSEEFVIVLKDGRSKWHTTTIHPVLDNNGEVIGLYGIVQNVSSAKLNRKDRELYPRIFDQLPAALTVLNTEGEHVYKNQAAAAREINSPTRSAESRRSLAIKQCIAFRQPVTFEEKKPDSEGHERIYLMTLFPLRDDSGNMEYFIEYGLDITANKAYELELQRMAYVAEKTSGIVMITDPERRIIWINNSFERILGYRTEEVIGRNPAEFLQGPDTSAETIREISDSLKSTGSFSGEILNYTKNGDRIWLYLNIAAVHDDSGKLINYVAVENDITQIKLAEQRSQQAMEKERELNRFKTQFVNLASHQFRTPLATIRSSIDLLDLKIESTGHSSSFADYFRKHKAIMTEETIRMTELMENILDIGRMDEGKIELAKKNLPFKTFMDAFVQSNAEPGGQYRKLNYRFNAPDKIISMDEILMRNVLRNIVSNAFKYSEGKQAPELTVYCADDAYFIRIKDYGIGIPEKDQPFLFQSFFRASNAKNFPGSGLGLMIAKRLILLHGGTINCESKAGSGCTVTIQCA